MFRSIASAPALATSLAATRMTAGSCPNSWIDTGPSYSRSRESIRSISTHVRSLPWKIACEESISETAMPAPWRLACSRTNQLPMPASGASITRLGTLRGPSCQGSVRRVRVAMSPLLWDRRSYPWYSRAVGCRSGRLCVSPANFGALGLGRLRRVHLVDEAQSREREQVIDLVDLLGKGHDQARKPTGGDRHRRARRARRRGGAGSHRSRRRSRRRRPSGSRRSCSWR